MKTWLQRHDFSSDDLTDPSIEFSLLTFKTFDWQSEITLAEKALDAGVDCCSAGLGLVHEDGRILHIVQQASGDANVHYSYTEQKKILGMIQVSRHTNKTVEAYSLMHTEEIFKAHYSGAHKDVLRLLMLHGTRT